ncbi:nuclear transport factor 2 family protein [uncultured Pseudoteredinibacter sp.]|uniref:nuclear transport factor 2 family protein n=1 Tax=uncultured Pseudoteredinibacter sp. TaxID=1641701 RepID=UPI00263826A8|nr:nuclear transport factor 2 family protein [uncultured Pseudoteredinibacter sp.]
MSNDQTTIDKWECAQVAIKFMRHLDNSEYQEMASMMAPDGNWIRRDGNVIKGPDGLLNVMGNRPTNIFVRHLITNTEVQLLSETEAHCESYVCVYRHDFDENFENVAPLGDIELIATYHDKLVKIDNEWKIQEKYLGPSIFERPKV